MIYQLSGIIKDASSKPLKGRRVEIGIVDAITKMPVIVSVQGENGSFIYTPGSFTTDSEGRFEKDLVATNRVERVKTVYKLTINQISTFFRMPEQDSDLADLINQPLD